MEEAEICPCPSCGRADVVHHTDVANSDPSLWRYWVACRNTECLRGPVRSSQREAIAEWNSLFQAAKLRRLIEASRFWLELHGSNQIALSRDAGEWVIRAIGFIQPTVSLYTPERTYLAANSGASVEELLMRLLVVLQTEIEASRHGTGG